MLLVGLLGPAVPGARCAGRAPAWDLEVHGETAAERAERHAAAIAECGRCGALQACGTAVDGLPREATGIWAGRVLPGIRHRKP